MSRAADVVERYVQAIEARDAEAFGALFAEDATAHHPLYDEPVRGRDAIREGERALFESFSEVAVDVRTLMSEGDRCVAEVVLKAANTGPLDLGGGAPLPATGRTIELPATWWLELDGDGLVVESRDYLDTSALMRQLGLQTP